MQNKRGWGTVDKYFCAKSEVAELGGLRFMNFYNTNRDRQVHTNIQFTFTHTIILLVTDGDKKDVPWSANKLCLQQQQQVVQISN